MARHTTARPRSALASAAALTASVALALVSIVPALADPARHGPAPTATSGTSLHRNQTYRAVVNVPPETPGADGYAGSVGFRAQSGEPTTVDVFLSRAREVTCDDGAIDFATSTIQTLTPAATEPGPVLLDIDRRVKTAQGRAVVDLQVTQSLGCGSGETVEAVPAQEVAIDVTGTTVRFFTGFSGTSSTRDDEQSARSYDFARDGTGTASVGSFLSHVASDSAFLVYAVDTAREHGNPAPVPDPAAPPGGTGAQGAFAREYAPADGLGVVFADAMVSAGTTAPPERATTVVASSLVISRVLCDDGSEAESATFIEGFGPGELSVGGSLSSALADAVVTAERWDFDGCAADAETTATPTTVSVSLALTATGPTIRVRDTRWQVVPGGGGTRTQSWYEARQAVGTVAVDAVSGERAADRSRLARGRGSPSAPP